MTALARGFALTIGMLVFGFAGAATAQENIDAGKTAAQLYAADCAICHKTMRGMSRASGFNGLEGYLRLHYTSSRQMAAAIASYIRATESTMPPAQHERAAHTRQWSHSKAANSSTAKPAQKKAAAAAGKKPGDKKTGAAKPMGIETTNSKGTDAEAKMLKPKAALKPARKQTKPD